MRRVWFAMTRPFQIVENKLFESDFFFEQIAAADFGTIECKHSPTHLFGKKIRRPLGEAADFSRCWAAQPVVPAARSSTVSS